MKNISLSLNVVLLAAVAFLYYKIYSKSESPGVTHLPLPESGIVFINSDNLLDKYDLFNSLKSTMEHKQDSVESILKRRSQELDGEVQVYQKQAIGMTDMEKQQVEEKLMLKQQNLVQLKQEMMGALTDEETIMNDSIHNSLIGYLKEFNKSKSYQFILGYQKGGGILLADDALDITNAVLEGINKK